MAAKNQRWIRYDFDESWDIPCCPGVYVIYGNGEVIYVGQSRCIARRLEQYAFRWAYSDAVVTPWGFFDTISVKIRPTQRYGDWLMIELRLIRRLRPPANSVGSVRKRGEQYLCGMASDWNIQEGVKFRHEARRN